MTVFDIVLSTHGTDSARWIANAVEKQRQMDKLDEYKDTIDGLNLSRAERIKMIDEFIAANDLYLLKI